MGDVVEFKREGWRDAAKTLRLIADEIDSGVLEACSVGALVMMDRLGEVKIFGLGPLAEDLQVIAILRLGEQLIIDTILNAGDQ